MKRKPLLFLLLLALMAPWAAQAQTTVEIGDGTSAGNYTPIGTYYNYSITEQLYTADEIGTAGTITSISFYYAYVAAMDFPITVYMANVDATDLSTGISLAEGEEVFDGTLSVTEAGWVTIELDAPFAYDGTSNLLIGVNKGYCQWFSGSTWAYTAAAGMARYTQNDDNAYDTSTVPGTVTNNRPNIQMVITAGSGPVCDKPETFEVSNVTTTTATLTWTGGSGNYNVEYKGGSVADWTAYLTNTTATTANLTGLTPGTNYQYRVQSVCTDGVSGWKSVSFMTMFGIPLVEGFGTAIPSGWSIYSGLVENVLAGGDLTTASYGWSFGSSNGVFDNHARVNIYGTGCKYWLVTPSLLMENNVQLMFDVAYTAYSGTGAPAQTGDDDKFVVLVNNGSTWEIVRQWDNAGSEYVLNDLNPTPTTFAIDLSSYAGQSIAVAFYGESTVSNADNNLHIDNVNIDYIPNCPKPTGFAVNYEGGTEATISWNSDAPAWNLRIFDVAGAAPTIIENVTNPYTLTGLELATTYQMAVQANCGNNGTSEWTNTVSFTTDACMPENMCAITIELTDAYGDGGGQIEVVDVVTNEVLGTYTGSGASASYTLIVCEGREINFVYASTDSWPYENGWVITDINGEIISEHVGCTSGCDSPTNGVVANYTVNCTVSTCLRPTNLAVSNIGSRSAVLSWTENGEATEWLVEWGTPAYAGPMYVSTISNPYTFTDLDPETTYTVRVRPLCDEEKWSDVVHFTTLVACPAPTGLTVVPTTVSANVSWTSESNVDLRYVANPNYCFQGFVTDPDAMDDGSNASWIHGSNTFGASVQYAYGYMLADDFTVYTATTLNEIEVYGYQTGSTTESTFTGLYAMILNGNPMEGEVDTIWGDMTTNLMTSTSFTNCYRGSDNQTTTMTRPIMAITAAVSVDLEPGTYWLVYSLDGTGSSGPWGVPYCDPTLGSIGDGLQYSSGSWAALDDDNTGAYGCAMKLVFDDIESFDWTYVNDISANEYELTDLDPETTYLVQVHANCGEDGESAWTSVIFTTLSNCEVPSGLNVTNLMPTSATLNWEGIQDSYEVWYRPSALGTVLLEDSFENGIDNWTTIDADGDGNNWDLMTNFGFSGAPRTGSDMVVSMSYNSNLGGALTPDNYLVSPQVELGGSITFWACAQDASYAAEHFGVAVSTTGNTDAADFTTIAEWTLSAKSISCSPNMDCRTLASKKALSMSSRSGNRTMGTWYQFTVDLSNYAGQTGYVALRHFDCTDWFYLDVDDITIYGPAQEEQEWIPFIADNTTLDLDLDPETTYEWQVRGVNLNCPDGVTEWSEMGTFTTLSLCATPDSLYADALEPTTAVVSWTGYQNSYNVRYRTATYYDLFFYEDFLGDDIEFTGENLGEANNEYGYASGWYNFTSGSSAWIFWPDSELTGSQYIISTEMLPVYEGTTLEFGAANYAGENVFKLGFSSTDNDIESFTWSDEIEVSDSYVEYEVPEGTTYFAIEFPSSNTGAAYFFDFIAYANYTPAGEWVTLSQVTSPFGIDGLALNTEYEWQVQGLQRSCSNSEGEAGVTDWSDINSFVTSNGLYFFADGDWNDATNWYFGEVPEDYSDVTINANAFIPDGYDARVNSIIFGENGSLTILDGGQLHSNYSVDATIEKNIAGYGEGEGNWYLISSPISEIAPAQYGLTEGNYDLYAFYTGNAGNEWVNYKDNPFDMVDGFGYLYAKEEDATLSFTGTMYRVYNNYFYNGIPLAFSDTLNTNFNWTLAGNMLPYNVYAYVGIINDNNYVELAEEQNFYKLNDEGTMVVASDNVVRPCEGIFVRATGAGQYVFFSAVEHDTEAKGKVSISLVEDNNPIGKTVVRNGKSRNAHKLQFGKTATAKVTISNKVK
ncbi:MAG: choice-of-anchor J domain-containing protein [Bacteroidales bacterium]|nr:choice-of-anchor J domain-containing protein [Bacteroidales bacterium]